MMVFFLGEGWVGVCIERESGDCDGWRGCDRESRQGGGCIVPMESMIP